MTHIGQIIEKELHRQERSVTWFARRLYCDRTNVYNIFRRQSLDTELLLRISIILEYNFFQIYSDIYKEASKVNTITYELMTDIGMRIPRIYIKNGKIIDIINYLGEIYEN